MYKLLCSSENYNKLNSVKAKIRNSFEGTYLKQKTIRLHQSPFTGNLVISLGREIKFKIRQRVFRDALYIKLK